MSDPPLYHFFVAPAAANDRGEPVTVFRAAPSPVPVSSSRPRRISVVSLLVAVLTLLVVLATLPALVAPVAYSLQHAVERAKADVARELLRDFPEAVERAPWVIKSVAPSVVGIETFGTTRRGIAAGEGSGVIVDAAGFIITNYHVIAAADEVVVQLLDGRRISGATLVGYDRVTDLAVLKITPPSEYELLPIAWGDSAVVEVGETVFAIGNPFGFSHTATSGIVSAKERYSASPSSRRVQEYLQIDAAINPGNSGGALVDTRGQLIGINTMIAGASETFSGIGLAIPSNLARQVYERLRADGVIVHGWLGVALSHAPRGAMVTLVAPASPAAEAGIVAGDVIITWNGSEVRDHRRLTHTVITTPPETQVPVTLLRDGNEREITVTVGRRPVMNE